MSARSAHAAAAPRSRGEPGVQRLPPWAARVLYGVADALAPAAPGRPGGGDLDLVPPVERRLTSARERRKLELVLALLEWEPRVRLRSLRGFAWLAVRERRALLAAWEASPLMPRRQAAAWLRELVEAALAEARGAAAGPPPPQFLGGP